MILQAFIHRTYLAYQCTQNYSYVLLRKHVAKSTFYVVVEILTAFISLVTVVLGFAQTQTVELLYSAINSPTY